MSNNNQLLISLSIEIWRTKKRLIGLAEHDSDFRAKVESSFDRIQSILDDAKIEVVDHLGKPYTDGMVEEVVFFEKGDTILPGEKIVSETIKPTIYIDKELKSIGQIVVLINDSAEKENEDNNGK